MSKVEIIRDDVGIQCIKIDGLLHLAFNEIIVAMHSYIDEMTRTYALEAPVTYKMYYINFHLVSGQMVHCEYNDRELWETILKGL